MSRFPPPPPPRFQRRPEIDERKYSWKGRIVFLSNIPYCYKAQDLLVIMRQFGRVFRCDLSRAENGKSKGFAFIEFEKVESAKLAVEYMDTATLLNKNLRCEISEFPPDELVEMYVFLIFI